MVHGRRGELRSKLEWLWFEHLVKIFIKHGLKPTVIDPCLFVMFTTSLVIKCGTHVDDFVLTTNDWERRTTQNSKIFRFDRPRAKGVGVPLASRRGCSRAAPTKKRADLGSSCHVGHGSATLVVGAIERKKLRKPGLMSPTEKPAQTGRNFFLEFF